MATQNLRHGDEANDTFRMHASPVGARILQRANKIQEDFPLPKYLFYFSVFAIEVAVVFVVFWYGLRLIH